MQDTSKQSNKINSNKEQSNVKQSKSTEIDMSNFIEIDQLKLYFGDDIKINENIILRQPRIGEIVEFGERHFYSVLSALTCIPSDMKSELWDMNKTDWQTVDDFELFVMLTRGLTKDDTKLFFSDLDLSTMIPINHPDTNQLCLVEPQQGFIIDKLIYLRIVTYIRTMFGINPKIEFAKNKRTFDVLIEDDRFRKNLHKKEKYTSGLLPLISSMLNSPGFKYTKDELRQVGIVEFMDSVQRISTIVSTTALLHGMYSGMMDTSKIKSDQFNWLRDLSSENKEHKGVMSVEH